MKSMRKDTIIEKKLWESTQNEFKILKEVDHPFLVGMKFIIDTKQHVFFICEFIRGGELWQYLSEVPQYRIPENHAKFYTLNIAIGIGHLHSKNVIYRDLKPDNVLIDEQGYLHITDFGLSKFHGSDEVAHTVLGTPDYIAPDILKRKGYSLEVDWWSLGIITYEMIVGRTPFHSSRGNDPTFNNIQTKDYLKPSKQKHGFEFSANALSFIDKCL